MRTIQGRIYLSAAFFLAGTSVITGRFLTVKLSGFTITCCSMGIVLIGLLPFYGRKTMQTIRSLRRNDFLFLFLQAVFGIVLFRLFLLLGIKHTTAAEAGILTGATPAITALMAYFFLKEKFSAITAAGIASTVGGIVLLQEGGLHALQLFPKHIMGNMLVFCAAASESTFNITSRKHRSQNSVSIHPMVQTILVSAFAFCLSFLPAVSAHPAAVLAELNWMEWGALLWYGLVVTALAFAFFYAGANRCNAYTIAAYSGMMPITSMLLSTLLLRENITMIQWIGSTLILIGMYLIGNQKRRKPC